MGQLASVPNLFHWNCIRKGSLHSKFGQEEQLLWPKSGFSVHIVHWNRNRDLNRYRTCFVLFLAEDGMHFWQVQNKVVQMRHDALIFCRPENQIIFAAFILCYFGLIAWIQMEGKYFLAGEKTLQRSYWQYWCRLADLDVLSSFFFQNVIVFPVISTSCLN